MGIRPAVAALLLLAVAVASSPLRAECIDYRSFIRWTGWCPAGTAPKAIALDGDLAYVVGGAGTSGLTIVDLSDPIAPIGVASIELPDICYGVACGGGHAFIAAREQGLLVVDVSNPATPHLVGSANTPDEARGVAVAGTHAYVADFGTGLVVVDVSAPGAPIVLGSVFTPGTAFGVAVAGQYAFVADYAAGLTVVDVSYPWGPRVVASADTPGLAIGVTLSGEFACVADDLGGLSVIGISDPEAPQLLATLPLPDPATAVAVTGTRGCVGTLGPFILVDLTNPAAPAVIATLEAAQGTCYGAAAAGPWGFAVGPGLHIFDIGPSELPPETGAVDTPGTAQALGIAGGFAYVADGAAGVEVINLSDPAHPSIVATLDTPGDAHNIALEGTLACVADGSRGLRVVDISDPLAPVEVGALDTPGQAQDVAVENSLALVADGWGEARLVDISTPSSPQLVGVIPGLEKAGVALDGPVAYVTDSSAKWFEAFDITDPAAPALLDRLDLAAYPDEIVLAGTSALVLDGSGVCVVDVSDPQDLRVLSRYPLPGPTRGAAVAGTLAWTVTVGTGAIVFDLEDPLAPRTVGSSGAPLNPQSVAIAGDLVLVADAEYGVRVLPGQCELSAGVDGNLPTTRHSPLVRPNPARGVVRLESPVGGATPARLGIFDAAGGLVRILAGPSDAATTETIWDGRDCRGRAVPAGIYFVRILERPGPGARVVLVR